jgi:hypothetical protein
MSYSGTPKITVLSGTDGKASRPNRKLYFALGGGVLVALLLGGGLRLWQSQASGPGSTAADSPSPDAITDGELGSASAATADFAEPFVAAAPSLTLPDPDLLQSTSAQTRVPAIAAGRPDPFAPLVTPARIPSRPVAGVIPTPPPPPTPMAMPTASPPPVARPSTAQPRPTVSIAATQALPPLPTITMPSLPIPPIPGGFPMAAEAGATTALLPSPGAPSRAVDQVVVSGVVQVGQQVHAIITEPGNPSGRRVSQGDTVAGGQVRIKAIDLSSTDPTVVLTYNGRDYYRSVGAAGLP